MEIDVEKLVLDKELILAIPKELYNLEGRQVVLHDTVEDMLHNIKGKCSLFSTGEEEDTELPLLADLVDDDEEVAIHFDVGTLIEIEAGVGEKRKVATGETSMASKKKRRRIISSDEEDDTVKEKELNPQIWLIAVGVQTISHQVTGLFLSMNSLLVEIE